MFDLRRIPVARILIPFSAGGIAGYRDVEVVSLSDTILACGLLWILLLILFMLSRNGSFRMLVSFCVTGFSLMLAAGYGTGVAAWPGDPCLPEDQRILACGMVLEPPVDRGESLSFDMKLRMISCGDQIRRVSTVLLVNLEKPPDQHIPECERNCADVLPPASGEIWLLLGRASAIRNHGNPAQTDYKTIMNRKNCWYRFYAYSKPVVKIADPAYRGAFRIREAASGCWNGEPEELALLRAVCLGERSGLTDDMRQSYSHAGGMHLLAVSGLHVGLIWWVLRHGLSWMVSLFRREIYRAITIVCLLWLYASVTGFSTPVCRSVLMFSLFTAGRLMEQRTHPVNTILVSAFVLIVYHPGRVTDVGFQLSYGAVTGIVSLYRPLKYLLPLKNRVLSWIWEITSVSIAAQLATAPLVAYYFHQLPLYALLTNLLAIPLLSCLIVLFVVSVPFLLTGQLPQTINWLMVKLARIMNLTMEGVSALPGSVMENLHVDRIPLILVGLIIFFGLLCLHHRQKRNICYLMVAIASMLCYSSWKVLRTGRTAEFTVTHFHNGSLVIFRHAFQVDHYIWSRDTAVSEIQKRYVETSWKNRYKRNNLFNLQDPNPVQGSVSCAIPVGRGSWFLGNDRFRGYLLGRECNTQSVEFVMEKGAGVDFVLLSGEPCLPDKLKADWTSGLVLIADGSNRFWYTDRLHRKKRGIWLTREEGAYVERW